MISNNSRSWIAFALISLGAVISGCSKKETEPQPLVAVQVAKVEAKPLTSSTRTPYNGYAHSFAGMAVQFILFAGIDAGVLLLLPQAACRTIKPARRPRRIPASQRRRLHPAPMPRPSRLSPPTGSQVA